MDLSEEGEEEDVDVPLPEDDDSEEEVDIQLQRQPMPVPSPPQSHIDGGRRQLTLATPSSTLSTRVVGASSSTPGSDGPPPRPPTASRGRVVPFTYKRGRGN